jgi:hypothetical protein
MSSGERNSTDQKVTQQEYYLMQQTALSSSEWALGLDLNSPISLGDIASKPEEREPSSKDVNKRKGITYGSSTRAVQSIGSRW